MFDRMESIDLSLAESMIVLETVLAITMATLVVRNPGADPQRSATEYMTSLTEAAHARVITFLKERK
jgi:hypothetical protein